MGEWCFLPEDDGGHRPTRILAVVGIGSMSGRSKSHKVSRKMHRGGLMPDTLFHLSECIEGRKYGIDNQRDDGDSYENRLIDFTSGFPTE